MMDLEEPTKYPFTELPDDLEVGTDPEDGWTQVIYDQHQIAAHEPEFDETHLWLHLLEDQHRRPDQSLTELIDDFELLEQLGFEIVDQRPVPIGEGQTIRIVTMEGTDLDDEAIREGVEWAYRLSGKAIREREL